MHPELIQLLDVDLRIGRHVDAERRQLAAACPRVVDGTPGHPEALLDGVRRRLGFWLVAAGLRLALPRA